MNIFYARLQPPSLRSLSRLVDSIIYPLKAQTFRCYRASSCSKIVSPWYITSRRLPVTLPQIRRERRACYNSSFGISTDCKRNVGLGKEDRVVESQSKEAAVRVWFILTYYNLKILGLASTSISICRAIANSNLRLPKRKASHW